MLRKNDCKRGAFIWLASAVDNSIMILDYLFAQCKTDTSPAISLFSMQTLEYGKDLFTVLLFKTNSVIGEIHLVVSFFRFQFWMFF